MPANPRTGHVRRVATLVGHPARSRADLVLVGGPQSLRGFLVHRSGEIVDVYASEGTASSHLELLELARQRTRWVHVCTKEVIRETSGDAQGLVTVAKKGATSSVPREVPAGSATALIAQGRSPDNVGAIIRTADAMDTATVITVAGTVEVGSPKVLQASADSVFHLSIMTSEDFKSTVRMVHFFKGTVLGIPGGFGTLDLDELIKKARTGSGPLAATHVWAFDNETRGLSPAEFKTCDPLVPIPMTGTVESLSVASAAAMCLFASQNARRFR